MALTTVAPLLALVATSVTRSPGLPLSVSNWTGDNYRTGLRARACRPSVAR